MSQSYCSATLNSLHLGDLTDKIEIEEKKKVINNVMLYTEEQIYFFFFFLNCTTATQYKTAKSQTHTTRYPASQFYI